ncbi:hypothetical protein D3C80_2048990 [compost metagenome]
MADGAPAFDTDQAGDLALLRQALQLFQRPGRFSLYLAGDFQLIAGQIHFRHVVLGVKRVKREGIGDLVRAIGLCQLLATEQPGLHPIVPA